MVLYNCKREEGVNLSTTDLSLPKNLDRVLDTRVQRKLYIEKDRLKGRLN